MESQTLQSWFEKNHRSLTTQGEYAKAHLLRQSYFRTLEYSIAIKTDGYSPTETGLISTCFRLYETFCWQYRISR